VPGDLPGGPRPAAAARTPRKPRTLEARLFEEGYVFDFYQAVRVLQRLRPASKPVGHSGPLSEEPVRFRALVSLSFPPSSIYELQRVSTTSIPLLTQAVIGLTGPSGVLPRHYTELLIRVEADAKGPEKNALRDWLDIFNHRLVSFFYRAWEKYRFYLPFERGEFKEVEAGPATPSGRDEFKKSDVDPFTRCLTSLVGLGTPHLRGRLCIIKGEADADAGTRAEPGKRRTLARIEDMALLYYSGLFSHRPRCAVALEAILRDYFQLEVVVRQFQGQWLSLAASSQTRLGDEGGNNRLGATTVVGEKVWDVQSKIRVRVGPLAYRRFIHFMPHLRDVAEGNAFFVLTHLVRLYLGPELDFDVQVILEAKKVPRCRLSGRKAVGPLLGWNTWLRSLPMGADAEDAVFEGKEVYRIAEDELPVR
jgi:type VI secretion system protein ImpH